jgi:hypothetical protein
MRPNDFRFLRVPKWVVILGVTGLILISITLVGLGFAAFQVGSQLVAVVRDAPAFISAQSERASTDPRVAAALDRKLSCVDLIGGSTANETFATAIEYAPTPEVRARIEEVGKKLGLPRKITRPPGELFSHCVWGSTTAYSMDSLSGSPSAEAG